MSEEKAKDVLDYWFTFDNEDLPEPVPSDLVDGGRSFGQHVIENTDEGYDRDEALRAIRAATLSAHVAMRNARARREAEKPSDITGAGEANLEAGGTPATTAPVLPEVPPVGEQLPPPPPEDHQQ